MGALVNKKDQQLIIYKINNLNVLLECNYRFALKLTMIENKQIRKRCIVKESSPRRDLNNFIIRFYIFIPLFWGLYKMTML